MQEDLISFETAKLAKEKGFDWDCVNYFQDSHRAGVHKINNINNKIIDELHQEDKYCIIFFATPTQSLLQKWLREVHNIYVESYHDLTSDGTKIQFYTSWGFLQQKDKNGNRNVNGWYDEYNDWKTYEEALEIGLQEGLKLLSDEFY